MTHSIGDWGLGIGDWAQSPIPILFLNIIITFHYITLIILCFYFKQTIVLYNIILYPQNNFNILINE